jgi:four helix bundle protein
MPISDFRNLQCWQLASSIREEVIAICANERVAADFRFCTSFLDAAGSVCRNLSEGFARFESPQILVFFGYALASLAEVQDHLEECRARRLIDQRQYEILADRAQHTKAAALRFLRPHRARAARRGRPHPRRGR